MFHTCLSVWYFFFFKQKTAYEMRISDWSSDVCSSDLQRILEILARAADRGVPKLCARIGGKGGHDRIGVDDEQPVIRNHRRRGEALRLGAARDFCAPDQAARGGERGVGQRFRGDGERVG